MTLIQRFDRPPAVRRSSLRRLKRRFRIDWLLMGWLFAVTLYFAWEAASYRGLYGRISEWQFVHFGHYSPILTFMLLVLLFGSPALWILRFGSKRFGMSKAYRTRVTAETIGSRLRKALYIFSAGLAAASLATLVWTLTLPTFKPPYRIINVGGAGDQRPASGATMITGHINYLRTSAFAQDLIVTKRGVRFAPMEAPGRNDGTIRYFVELLPVARNAAPPVDEPVSTKAGILMPDALPGSIVRLYEYAGYKVERPYYVLFTNPHSMRWPYYLTAIQLALGALLSLIAAGLQDYHLRGAKGTKKA
jgi:hypothetical protein